MCAFFEKSLEGWKTRSSWRYEVMFEEAAPLELARSFTAGFFVRAIMFVRMWRAF
jgi:hypothetical protein